MGILYYILFLKLTFRNLAKDIILHPLGTLIQLLIQPLFDNIH